jgi:TonB family protein
VSLFLSLVSGLLYFFLILQTATPHWKEYTSQEGKFTVLLPGEPTAAYRPVTGESTIYINHITNVQTSAATYSIGFFDIPVDFTESGKFNQLFNNTRDTIIKLYSLELQEEAEILWRGYAGRSWRMDSSQGKQFLTIIFLVKHRVYYLSVNLPNNQADLSDVGKFYESFKPIPLTDDDLKKLQNDYKSESGKVKSGKLGNSETGLEDFATKKVAPAYPITALRMRFSGTVRVKVLVSEDGQVIEAEVIDGPNNLHEASLRAAKQWRFKPVLIGGNAVKIYGVLQFNFALK